MSDDDRGETDALIGRVLSSRYRVEHKLGSGAMGAVYRARHVKVGRSFAVKVLHQRLLDDDKLKKRFEREAELAGKLHHINVVGVVDVGETEDGIHFMVMEYADGPALSSLMTGPMEAARAIPIIKQLLDGLAHAHDHGLVHRDFKPENVIVETDRARHERPRIVDFGVAILRDHAGSPGREDRLTTAGLVLGTPHYMAPEQATGESIDHRIDLFALGVTVYELLTGQMPFEGDGVDVARANLLNATPPMGIRVPGIFVDPLLEAFTRKLMEKSPDARPASAKAARALLELIERDRAAAAAAFGVVDTLAVPIAVPQPVLPAARAVPTPIVDARAPTTRAPTTDRMPESPRGKRTIAIAVGSALVAAIAIVLVATHGSAKHDDKVASAPPVALADAAVAEETTIDAQVVAAVDAAPAMPPVEDAAADEPIKTTANPTRPSNPANPGRPGNTRPTRPTRPTGTAAPTGPDTSAAAVANLYGQVGRELKALDTAKGSGATSALWPRYLRIRINDVLTTPEKRAEAQRALAQLHAQIGQH